ncbi:cAMP-regulated phosphoprotein/endosulfine conserved region domain containing protein [Naviculisporaceae sp. PSN 640]
MNSPKVNINSLTPQEARLYRLYGRVPSQTHHFAKHLKERKYFDSGDYALSKAGRADSAVGSLHPEPSTIPHPHPPTTSSPDVGVGKPSFSRSGSFSSESVEDMVSPKLNMKPLRSASGAGTSA